MILRGINLPVLDDWDFHGSDKLAELEKSGANAVRIQWYQTYGSPERPPYHLSDLDDLLTRCRAAAMIPIVMLADLTCQPDISLLNSQLIPWWTSEPVAGLLKKHCDYLIINLANDRGVSVGTIRNFDERRTALRKSWSKRDGDDKLHRSKRKMELRRRQIATRRALPI